MPYSAVTQPRPWPFSQGGSRSSSVAVTSTWVSPNLTRQEPSAYLTTPRSSDTARSSSGARRLGRMEILRKFGKGSARGACRSGQAAAARLLPPLSGTQWLLVTGPREMDRLGGCCEGSQSVAHHDPIGLITPNAGFAQLNERSREIFRQIVESYLATGEPVGSRNISRLIAVPLSPASVRNVMAGPRAARPDLRAAYLGRPAADGTGLAVLRRRPDAGRRSHRAGAAIDPEPACLRRPGAVGRGGARRGPDAAVRPDPRRRRGADREIQFAAEAYRIRAAGAGAGAGGAGRRGRPGREPRADACRRGFPLRR